MTELTLVDTAGAAGEAALDTVVGGAAMAVDAATRPRRTVARARRRGAAVNEAVAEVTEDVVDEVLGLPERALVAYLRMLRRRARGTDPLGTVSRALLRAVHGRAKDAARFFARVEREATVERPRRKGTAGGSRATSRSRSGRATARHTTTRRASTRTRRATR